MISKHFLIAVFYSILGFAASSHATEKTSANRPNVLVVMVDDLGFSDVGCFGGEIETPTLDRLAAQGLRFSQFYNTAKCHSSRISLLTGCYAFQAGNTSLSHAVTSAEVLKQAGYHTMMTGKWHLKQQPTDFGFDRYFGHLSGACNYFLGDKTFRLNGKPWKVPESGFYTTIANVDFALDFLQESRSLHKDKPWYLYVAFNAPHAPLHALEKDYRKYEGRYDTGWDNVRDARIAKQKRIGLLPSDVEPSPRPDHVPAWDSLSKKRRDWESRRMTALAAMIDRVDQELGRLVADLETNNELANTLILFVSDNGACPYDRRSDNLEAEPTNGSVRWGDTTGWAWARNGPFRYYKQNQYEGGISSPGIVHWPDGLKTRPGTIVDDPVHLIDVLPTLAEVCDAPIPKEHPTRQLRPISGVSFAPVLAGNHLSNRPPIHLLFSTDRGLRVGDWKAVSFRSQPWELYNMAEDRCELNDLSAQHPERLKAMISQWTDLAENVLHAPKRAYGPVQSKHTLKFHPEWTDFSKEPASGQGKKSPKQTTRKATAKKAIRARRDTVMTISGDSILLTSRGNDSGIAIDRITQKLPAGPYKLTFQLQSTASGAGSVFFTTDRNTPLPKGQRQEFDVTHDGKWHAINLDLDTTESLKALRLDVCSGAGKSTIKDMTLLSADGKPLVTWPTQQQQ